MFDMSWGEIMVIGGVALIVIGPKDLPKALRTVGQMTSKVRRLAGEFQSQFSDAMREAELEDVKKEMEGLKRDVASAGATGFNPIQTIRDELKGAVDGPPKPEGPPDYGASATFSDASEVHGSAGDWSPLPEPPPPSDPILTTDATRPTGLSEYGPDRALSAAAADAVDPGTLNPGFINPEVQPPLPSHAPLTSPSGSAQAEEKRA